MEQISPDKHMTNLSGTNLDAQRAPAGAAPGRARISFPCTTAAFTLSSAPDGLRHLVLTRPGIRPSMQFLSVGSHVCVRASFRQTLAGLPLPSASSYIGPHREHYRYSYRGLSPHQFMPMPGVHNHIHSDRKMRCSFVALHFSAGDVKRYSPKPNQHSTKKEKLCFHKQYTISTLNQSWLKS